MNRALSAAEKFQLGRILVHAGYPMSQIAQSSTGGEADISGSDNSNIHYTDRLSNSCGIFVHNLRSSYCKQMLANEA
jgi:hypothetical protein